MTHVLGVYWAPEHMRQGDIAYIEALQPPAVRILEADASTMNRAHAAAPHALLLPRDWALSEQHDDVRRDPVGTGIRHAQDWRDKLDRWRAQGMKAPDSQIVVVGINEPRVWDMLDQTVAYNVAWLNECTRLGLRACALNLSVGWPANTGTDTPPDWSAYAPIEAAIRKGKHFLVCHEYWYRSGPQDGAGWWAWRINRCPWDVPIIIGECGVDNYVDMARWRNDGNAPRGWHGNIGAEAYAEQMARYARGLDKRVVAILPFLTDYRSNTWESFDTFAAHGALLARRGQMEPQAQFQVFIPSIPNKPSGKPEPQPMPQLPDVLDPLALEAIIKVESGGRNFGPDGRLLIRFEAHIFRDKLGNDGLWAQHFQVGAKPWQDQKWRRWPNDTWLPIHTGKQDSEWAAYQFAFGLNRDAALLSISMGAPQIMGFNHKRIGYGSARAMFDAFSRSDDAQVAGLLNYIWSNDDLAVAINAHDWRTVALLYNGGGNVDHYAGLMAQAYAGLAG